ncbi:hypothetical protein [Nonomuraea sp. LPB2021202275-12-8]
MTTKDGNNSAAEFLPGHLDLASPRSASACCGEQPGDPHRPPGRLILA